MPVCDSACDSACDYVAVAADAQHRRMQSLQAQLRQGTEQSTAQIQELQAQIEQLDGDQQASARRHAAMETALAQEKERADRCARARAVCVCARARVGVCVCVCVCVSQC